VLAHWNLEPLGTNIGQPNNIAIRTSQKTLQQPKMDISQRVFDGLLSQVLMLQCPTIGLA
jgi:hypothetical protein